MARSDLHRHASCRFAERACCWLCVAALRATACLSCSNMHLISLMWEEMQGKLRYESWCAPGIGTSHDTHTHAHTHNTHLNFLAHEHRTPSPPRSPYQCAHVHDNTRTLSLNGRCPQLQSLVDISEDRDRLVQRVEQLCVPCSAPASLSVFVSISVAKTSCSLHRASMLMHDLYLCMYACMRCVCVWVCVCVRESVVCVCV